MPGVQKNPDNRTKRFAELGRRFPTARVNGQVAHTNGLVVQFREKLLASGASVELLDSLGLYGTTLAMAVGLQQTARSGAKEATRNERGIVDTTKQHVTKLNKLVPMIWEDNNLEGFGKNDVKPLQPLGRSTDKLVNHFERVRPIIEKADAFLTPHFNGQSALAVHDQLTKALKEHQSAQSSKQSAVPSETFEVNVAKGKLVWTIDRINRIGQVAFIDQEHIASQFNKSILTRRSKRRAKDAAETESAEQAIDAAVSELGDEEIEPK